MYNLIPFVNKRVYACCMHTYLNNFYCYITNQKMHVKNALLDFRYDYVFKC